MERILYLLLPSLCIFGASVERIFTPSAKLLKMIDPIMGQRHATDLLRHSPSPSLTPVLSPLPPTSPGQRVFVMKIT